MWPDVMFFTRSVDVTNQKPCERRRLYVQRHCVCWVGCARELWLSDSGVWEKEEEDSREQNNTHVCCSRPEDRWDMSNMNFNELSARCFQLAAAKTALMLMNSLNVKWSCVIKHVHVKPAVNITAALLQLFYSVCSVRSKYVSLTLV